MCHPMKNYDSSSVRLQRENRERVKYARFAAAVDRERGRSLSSALEDSTGRTYATEVSVVKRVMLERDTEPTIPHPTARKNSLPGYSTGS